MPPLPKKKHSKRRQGGRFARYRHIRPVSLAECPQCHNAKLPHRMCRKCGYYNGREVVPVEADAGE